MSTRRVLFALLLVGALSAWGGFNHTTTPALADEGTSRPTPTAAPLPSGMEPIEAPAEDATEAEFPDLVVSAVRVLPSTPYVNRPVSIEVEIRNIGTGPVPTGNNFFVDLYIDPETPPRACLPGDFAWSVQAFQLSDGVETLRGTFDPSQEGPFDVFRDVGHVRIYAQVDTDTDTSGNRCGNVVETREDNNINFADADVITRFSVQQTSPEQFLEGFSSALDLTHPLGILQNGTGWFEEPRFPQPEDAQWPVNPDEPWNSPTFYNPDRHIAVDNLPDDYPTEDLPQWNPPDQENVDIEIGFNPETLYAVWEDARNGDLTDRDIYFSYSPDQGKTWSEPVRVNQDEPGSNQLNPQLAVDRVGLKIFVFWEDNRLQGSDYDIYYARSLDYGFTWEEPEDGSGQPSNPINDQNVDAASDQKNVTASVWYNDQTQQTHLYVAWEDYRNGNADIFFDYSEDSGLTWLKTPDNDPTTLDGNVQVLPDPSTNAGVFDQQKPRLFLDSQQLGDGQTVNYCITYVQQNFYYNQDGELVLIAPHFYPAKPLPRVYLVWQDKRDSPAGDAYSVYYTRGEFNYQHAALPLDPETQIPQSESVNCENGGPRPARSQENLPVYRFEDDHVRVESAEFGTAQINPVGAFDGEGFISVLFDQSITYGEEGNEVTIEFQCEVRWNTDELLITWEDDRDGNKDIFATNIFDDIDLRSRTYVFILESGPPPDTSPFTACLGETQGGQGNSPAPTSPPPEFTLYKNIDPFSPQPYEFYELSAPETDLKVSSGLTFTPKPQCLAPNEPPIFTGEPSDQTNPDLALLPIPPNRITQDKLFSDQLFVAKFGWGVWADKRNRDTFNEDIFLRPLVRADRERTLSVEYRDELTPRLPAFEFEDNREIALQTVQDNIKNQIILRRPGLQDDFDPPSAQQANPSVSFALFGDPDDLGAYSFYVGWDDNRNANPLIGSEGNKDVFAARLQLGDTINGGELRPTRTGTYLSSVQGNGAEWTWYDIEWWGDISADGVLTFQTRFGFDPNVPEPPQENIETEAWSQWTGVGGTGGFYNAPGQHITGPDGNLFPQSYYIQYRVNFNPAEGGQQGIHCISEVDLNYEQAFGPYYLPLLQKN